MTDNLWKTSTFREAVMTKINEAVRHTPVTLYKSGTELENFFYNKSKTKSEYLAFVARLILHFREAKANEGNYNGEIPGIPDDLLSFPNQETEGCSDNKTLDFGDLVQPDPHNFGQFPNQLRNQLSDLNYTQVSSTEVSNQVEEQVQGQVSLVNRNPIPFGVPLVNASAVGKKAPNDLVELAAAIQKADAFTQTNACSKLQVIVQQIRFLQQQAENILRDAKLSQDLHHVGCNFVKIPGKIYYLYQKPDGEQYFSMISPEEWTTCPNRHIGSFRLEYDQSWTPIHNIDKKDVELSLVNRIFDRNVDVLGLK